MIRHCLTGTFAMLLLAAFAAAAQERTSEQPPEDKPQEKTAQQETAAEERAPDETPADKAAAQKAPAADAPARKSATADRMELDATAITGNRELPKVLYIVPWKKSGLGDPLGRPANSLLDEVLAPVDREVFRRQTDYFATLNAGENPEQTTPPDQPAPAKSPQN